MSDFFRAVDVVLAHEGGYADNPDDPGGETNFGLSHRTYPDLDLKHLTREEAVAVYKRDWWDPYGFDEIADQRAATKVFDMAVNMGARPAVRCLQRALNYLTRRANEIEEDGRIGPATLRAANRADPELLILALAAYHARWYIDLVQGPDTRYETFAKTWLLRALSLGTAAPLVPDA